jgi:hypothetical protein
MLNIVHSGALVYNLTRMTLEGQEGNPGARAAVEGEARGSFVEDHIKRTRRRRLHAQYGEEEGERRMEIEIGLLTQVLGFLDTPGAERPDRRRVFTQGIRDEAEAAGYAVSDLMGRGSRIYPAWLEAKHRMQRGKYRGGGRRTHGTDPHVALGDNSHRRDGTRH